MLSTPVLEAASISSTSGWRPSMISAQWRPKPCHVEGRPVDGVGLVVQRARQDARGGRLADAAHAGQHVALGDAVGGERIAQRRHHRLLADQVGEGGRAILARQHEVGAGLGRRLAVAASPARLLLSSLPCLPDVIPAQAGIHVTGPHEIGSLPRTILPRSARIWRRVDRCQPAPDALALRGCRMRDRRTTRIRLVRAASFRT